MDLYDNYVVVLIFLDESDVPDEEYFYTTKTFDCIEIKEPVMFLSDYMRETLGSNLYIEYWIYDIDNNSEILTEYPTGDLKNYLLEDEEEVVYDKVSRLIIKYKW